MLENPGSGLHGPNASVWGTIQTVDDSRTMQRVDVRGVNGEVILGVERPQNYGHTSVPLPSEAENAAEVAIIFKNGDRAHPVVVATDDRRYHAKNLKGGESMSYDHQGQNLHIANDGMKHTAKSHVMSATEGSKPLTTFELNDQMKGALARIAHVEHTAHGLFDFMSQLNTIAMKQIPALAALAPVLNQAPTGLTMMTQAIVGKEIAYLQQHLQDALAKFTSPNIGAIGSLLPGGVEGLISAAFREIADLISANPVVALVDSLVDELASLNASASAAVAASMAPVIQGLIDSATASNAVVAQVADLRSTLAALMNSAGPGLNFLAPQQRAAQGLTRSLKLSQ
jgi:hypothetical protein